LVPCGLTPFAQWTRLFEQSVWEAAPPPPMPSFERACRAMPYWRRAWPSGV
jgi:hypothetical protein